MKKYYSYIKVKGVIMNNNLRNAYEYIKREGSLKPSCCCNGNRGITGPTHTL